MEMFEKSVRAKYRFETTKGLVSTEDLWDMPLTSRTNFDLDSVAINLAKKIAETSEMSFVKKSSSANKELVEKLDIVKYVITTKQAEADAKEQSAVKASEKAFLVDLLKEKQLEGLKNLSPEEIQAKIDALG